MNQYNVGSLFAGVGGICLGFKRASKEYRLVVANEWDSEAASTYNYNFNHNLIQGDIERILTPEIAVREQEFLIKRKNELAEKVSQELSAEDIKFQKKQISSLRWSYLLKCADGGKFFLSEKTEENLIKSKTPENEIQRQRDMVEYRLVSELLEERKGEWLEKELQELNRKRALLTAERIDVLTAGFPCQAFSIAGNKKGFSDHRGELFYSVLEWVKQLEEAGHGKPRVLFLENVKNLLSHDEGRTFQVITSEIEKMGYSIRHHKVFNTYEYTNLPQNRERIFVICFRDKEDDLNFGNMGDIPKLNRTKDQLKQALAETLDYSITKETNPELYYTAEKYPNYFQQPGDTEEDKRINLDEQMTEMYEVYQLRRGMYVRKNQSGVCPTLTANMGTGGHNVPLIKMADGIRKLSPKDCFNLQGFRVGQDFNFPSTMSNAPLYKQSGNAVSVDMVEILAKKILITLKKTDTISSTSVEESVSDIETPAIPVSIEIDKTLIELEKIVLQLKTLNEEFSNETKDKIKKSIFELINSL